MRYFFFDGKNISHSTCGVASQTLMGIYRRLNEQPTFPIDIWYDAISLSPNVVVLGYLVEHMCFAAIQRGALRIVDQGLDAPLESACFGDIPPLASLIVTETNRQFYVPSNFNFPNIDAAVVQLDRSALEPHVRLIEVTISESHKNSEDNFYSSQWKRWEDELKSQGYEVNSTFVWITREEPSAREVWGATRETRKARKTVTVYGRQSKRISLKSLDHGLHSAMEKAGNRLCT